MDGGVAAFLVGFGAASVAFGLWLRPKWRRTRQNRIARDDGLLFSPGRARERWLWLNTWGSIGLGVILFSVVAVDWIGRYLERVRVAEARARQVELLRYVAGCTRETLTLANRGSVSRRIKVAKLALVERTATLMAPDERWNATLRDPAEAVLGPGQSATLRFDSTPGVCGTVSARAVSLTFAPTRPYRCDLELDLDIGDLHDRVACKIE
jgi:hypothetical protein